jgi:hypothetical protein
MTYIDDGTSNYKKVSDKYACIPAYMFANTGIVNAVIPAQITDLATEGVFANCAQLETVAYENMLLDSNNVGAKFFAGCTKIREIVIPLGVGTFSYGLGEYEGCTALEKITFYSGDELVYCNSPSFLNCPNLKVFELVYVEDYETDENGKVTYTQTSQAHIATFNGSFFAGTGIEYFYTNSPEIIFGGHDFENSIIKVVVLDAADITMFGEGDGYGIFSNAKELKEVWIAGGEDGLYFSEDVFITLDHDINFYFTEYTYEEVVDMVGDSAWFTSASEYAHFYFKDNMPAGVEWPEELKSVA